MPVPNVIQTLTQIKETSKVSGISVRRFVVHMRSGAFFAFNLSTDKFIGIDSTDRMMLMERPTDLVLIQIDEIVVVEGIK